MIGPIMELNEENAAAGGRPRRWPPSTSAPTPCAWSSPRSCPTAGSRSSSGCSGRSGWARTPSAAAGWGRPACGPPWPSSATTSELLKLYHVERVRAVATSAAREASNADTFLDRIYIATGLKVEVIGTPEESRLTVSAVRQAVGDALGVNQGEALIADVGGGSTLLTLLDDGEIVTSQSLRLGSIRLQEMLSTSEDSPERTGRAAPLPHCQRAGGRAELAAAGRTCSRSSPSGGDARFAARQIGKPTDSEDLVIVEPAEFDKLVDRCERYTAEELSKRYGIPFAEAETLNPALLVYQNLLPPDAGPADDRLARLDARRAAAGAGPGGHRPGRPLAGWKA